MNSMMSILRLRIKSVIYFLSNVMEKLRTVFMKCRKIYAVYNHGTFIGQFYELDYFRLADRSLVLTIKKTCQDVLLNPYEATLIIQQFHSTETIKSV